MDRDARDLDTYTYGHGKVNDVVMILVFVVVDALECHARNATCFTQLLR